MKRALRRKGIVLRAPRRGGIVVRAFRRRMLERDLRRIRDVGESPQKSEGCWKEPVEGKKY